MIQSSIWKLLLAWLFWHIGIKSKISSHRKQVSRVPGWDTRRAHERATQQVQRPTANQFNLQAGRPKNLTFMPTCFEHMAEWALFWCVVLGIFQVPPRQCQESPGSQPHLLSHSYGSHLCATALSQASLVIGAERTKASNFWYAGISGQVWTGSLKNCAFTPSRAWKKWWLCGPIL